MVKSMEAAFQSVIDNWEIGKITSVSQFTTDKYRSSGNVAFVDSVQGRFVLKRLSNGSGKEPIFTALPQLHALGVPVAAPIATTQGALWAKADGSMFCLTPFLPGTVITSLDTDFTQTAGTSTLTKTTNPAGSALISETKVGTSSKVSSCSRISTRWPRPAHQSTP